MQIRWMAADIIYCVSAAFTPAKLWQVPFSQETFWLVVAEQKKLLITFRWSSAWCLTVSAHSETSWFCLLQSGLLPPIGGVEGLSTSSACLSQTLLSVFIWGLSLIISTHRQIYNPALTWRMLWWRRRHTCGTRGSSAPGMDTSRLHQSWSTSLWRTGNREHGADIWLIQIHETQLRNWGRWRMTRGTVLKSSSDHMARGAEEETETLLVLDQQSGKAAPSQAKINEE